MSHTVHLGGTKVKANQKYLGIELLGTGIEFTEDVELSINDTDFLTFPAEDEIYKVGTHTYVFKNDTVIKNIFLEKPVYSEVYKGTNNTDVALVATTESENIVLLQNTVGAVTDITQGEISLFFRLRNDLGGSLNITTRIYKTGVLYGTAIADTIGNGETNDYAYTVPVTGTFQASSDTIAFTVEVSGACTILGSEKESILQIRRDNL
jgi:hypothetical protein